MSINPDTNFYWKVHYQWHHMWQQIWRNMATCDFERMLPRQDVGAASLPIYTRSDVTHIMSMSLGSILFADSMTHRKSVSGIICRQCSPSGMWRRDLAERYGNDGRCDDIFYFPAFVACLRWIPSNSQVVYLFQIACLFQIAYLFLSVYLY